MPILFAVMVLAIAACSTSSPASGTVDPPSSNAPCFDKPLSCVAGETCWYTDTDLTQFACKRSKKGAAPGTGCDPFVSVPTCDDGSVCVRIGTAGPNICQQYCDPTHPSCPAGTACAVVKTINQVPMPLCIGSAAAPAPDAGPDAT